MELVSCQDGVLDRVTWCARGSGPGQLWRCTLRKLPARLLTCSFMGILLSCSLGCMGGGEPWTPPPVMVQDEYTFELVRLDGEDPGLGQFTDIKYLGGDRFLVAGSHGFITLAPDGEQGYRVVDTTAFSRPPEKLYGGQAMSLVDLDADGRYEAITDPNVMAARVILYDDDGAYLWNHTTPPGTSVWGIDYVAPVQADLDPELEIFFCYKNSGSARLIQFDGTMGPELMPSYHMPGLTKVFPVDVDGDGVDELICGPDKKVVLWSFSDGILASIDIPKQRAYRIYSAIGVAHAPGVWNYVIGRSVNNTAGWSTVTIRQEASGYTMELGPFIYGYDQFYSNARLSGSLANKDEGLWVSWNRIDYQRAGVGLSGRACQIMVGSTKYGLILRDFLDIDFYPKIGDGAGALKTDSDAVMEVWFVWVNGVWRLRIIKNSQEDIIPKPEVGGQPGARCLEPGSSARHYSPARYPSPDHQVPLT
jgi:hypothetical protein